MDHVFLKRNNGLATSAEEDLCERVVAILAEIETGGERTARRYAREFDKWDGEIIVSRDELCAAADRLPSSLWMISVLLMTTSAGSQKRKGSRWESSKLRSLQELQLDRSTSR